MVCVNVRSHIRAPACTRLHPLTPTCTRSHISHACGCADVRIFAHSHFHTHFQKFFCKTKLRQPHHARCTHFARVRVCGHAKFRTSALSHTYPKNFWKKKLWQPHHAHCTHFASVRVCGRAKFRTSALSHTSPQFFLPKKHLHAHYKSTCVSLQIHTFALISTFFLKKLGRIQDE